VCGRLIDQAALRKRKNSKYLFSGYAGIPLQEIIDRCSVLEILEEQCGWYVSAFEPPHTPGLAGSALHHRALAPVEHSRYDRPAEEEYKGGVQGEEPESTSQGDAGSAKTAWRGAAFTRASTADDILTIACATGNRENKRLPRITQRHALTQRLCCIGHELAGSFQRADSFSGAHATPTLARTLDILHVAAAMEIGRKEFVSFDKRQRNLAGRERLKILPGSD
jgi:hypothetical protein